MSPSLNIKTIAAVSVLLLSTASALYSGRLYWHDSARNTQILHGELIKDDDPYLEKFSAAAFQSSKGDYKHSVQTYGQLLELKAKLKLSNAQLAPVQYNIGNNLFRAALVRRQNEDGSLADEARYDLAQAKIAYEQALKLDPAYGPAKLNLSLLNAILSAATPPTPDAQAGVELSNLPIGLP